MLHTFLRHLRDDAFFRHNIVFFLGSMVIAFINYLYHPLMSRLLSVEQFGEVQVILSFVFISGVFLAMFNRMIVHASLNSAHPKLSGLYSAAMVAHVLLALLLVIFSPILSRFFSFESEWAFGVFAAYVIASVPMTFYTARVQAFQRFGAVSFSQGIHAVLKLVIGMLCAAAGYGVGGAIGGLVAGSIAAAWYARSISEPVPFARIREMRESLNDHLRFGVLVFLSLACTTILYAADVLIVKRLFSAEIAGIYSGIATIARLILFSTASIAAVFISSIKPELPEEHRTLLLKALGYVTVIGGSAMVLCLAVPDLLIRITLGTDYAEGAYLLLPLSISMLIISWASVCLGYLLAIRSRALLHISGGGIVLYIVLVLLYHETPLAITLDGLIAAVFTLVTAGLTIFMKHTR